MGTQSSNSLRPRRPDRRDGFRPRSHRRCPPATVARCETSQSHTSTLKLAVAGTVPRCFQVQRTPTDSQGSCTMGCPLVCGRCGCCIPSGLPTSQPWARDRASLRALTLYCEMRLGVQIDLRRYRAPEKMRSRKCATTRGMRQPSRGSPDLWPRARSARRARRIGTEAAASPAAANCSV